MTALQTDLSRKCKAFVLSRWGYDGLQQLKERPVSWVRYEANPHLKTLRRKQHGVPLIAIRGEVNGIHLQLSTEQKQDRE